MAKIFSGIQPSGMLTIGHYVGTIKHWLEMQNQHQCLFSIVDLHAITVTQSPEIFRKVIWDTMAIYIATGLDYNKHILFLQSHVPAHSELGWILQCSAPLGYLQRMTQFKDKSQQHAVNTGLLTYPTLMAADILLYDTDLVPVGDDQKQHLEFVRDIAEKFNHLYGMTFTIPEAVIASEGARIMSLQEPSKKMSKSDPNQNSWVAILDSPEIIVKKIKRAVTDSESVVSFDPQRPGISNLVTLYSCFSGKSYQSIEDEYMGQGYGMFKSNLADLIISKFTPIQNRYYELLKEPDFINNIMTDGAEKANQAAANILLKVKEKMGFI